MLCHFGNGLTAQNCFSSHECYERCLRKFTLRKSASKISKTGRVLAVLSRDNAPSSSGELRIAGFPESPDDILSSPTIALASPSQKVTKEEDDIWALSINGDEGLQSPQAVKSTDEGNSAEVEKTSSQRSGCAVHKSHVDIYSDEECLRIFKDGGIELLRDKEGKEILIASGEVLFSQKRCPLSP